MNLDIYEVSTRPECLARNWDTYWSTLKKDMSNKQRIFVRRISHTYITQNSSYYFKCLFYYSFHHYQWGKMDLHIKARLCLEVSDNDYK